MLKFSLLGVFFVILIFAVYVATRPNTFRYERSGVIAASPEKIYPYLSNFHLGAEWNPFDRKDPNMKHAFSGPESGVGAVEEFDGNRDVGAGRLEILKVVPNSEVELRLDMLRPLKGTNLVQYKLTPEAGGTRFTWTMSGEGNFLTKLFAVVIDCDKMIGGQFEEGIKNLGEIVTKK